MKTQDIQTLKYESIENIEKAVIDLSQQYLEQYDELTSIFKKKSLFSLDESDKMKVQFMIFLSLILANVGSNLQSPNAKDVLIPKIKCVGSKLGVVYSDLVNLTIYENDFLAILEKSESS